MLYIEVLHRLTAKGICKVTAENGVKKVTAIVAERILSSDLESVEIKFPVGVEVLADAGEIIPNDPVVGIIEAAEKIVAVYPLQKLVFVRKMAVKTAAADLRIGADVTYRDFCEGLDAH